MLFANRTLPPVCGGHCSDRLRVFHGGEPAALSLPVLELNTPERKRQLLMPKFGTNIRVSSETYRYLDSKKRDDESFDEALQRELGVDDSVPRPKEPKAEHG